MFHSMMKAFNGVALWIMYAAMTELNSKFIKKFCSKGTSKECSQVNSNVVKEASKIKYV